MKHQGPALLLIAAVAALLPLAPQRAAADPSPLLMQRLLTHPDAGRRTYMGERFQRLEDVRRFYEARDYEPVWDRQKLELLSYAFMAGREAGLDPQAFHFEALSREYSNDHEMAIELLATDAWMSLAAAMTGAGEEMDLPLYFEGQYARGRIYQGIAELAAFRAGRAPRRLSLSEHRASQ